MKNKSSHQAQDCKCSFCKIVKKFPKNYLLNTFHKFMYDHGYDSKYIFDWNMPEWFRDSDLEDPSIFYFIILPYFSEKYNVDILDYIDMIPEMKKWILKASDEDINLLFGGTYE